MEVEKSWSDVCLYSVSFKKKNEEIERKIYRSVAVPASWNEVSIKAYFLEAFKDITIIGIDYLCDGWYPLSLN